MSNVKNLKIGNITYAIRDDKAAHELSDIAVNGENVEFDPNYRERNFTMFGDVYIDEEELIASGFSAYDYLTTSNFLFNRNIDTFEIVTKFMYSDDSEYYDVYKCILESDSSGAKGVRFSLTNEEQRKLFYRIENANIGLEIRLYGTTEIVSGNIYYSKLTYDSNEGYKIYLSSDGQTWDLEAEDSSTSLPYEYAGSFCIGNNYGHSWYNAFEGELYLGEWYAKVNDVVVWTPFNDKVKTKIDVNLPEGILINNAYYDGNDSIAIGEGALASYNYNISIGCNSSADNDGSISIGAFSTAVDGIAIGRDAHGDAYYSLALGYDAYTSAEFAVQIGMGENEEAGTLCFGVENEEGIPVNYTIVRRDGTIPIERLGATSGDTDKFLKGDGTWAEVESGDSLPDQTNQNGKALFTDGTDAHWEKPSFKKEITLLTSNWDLENKQVVRVNGLGIDDLVIVTPKATISGTNESLYSSSNIRAIEQQPNLITFYCNTIPSDDVVISIGVVKNNEYIDVSITADQDNATITTWITETNPDESSS